MTVRALDPDTPPAPRIACYSHDTVGLGHTRRNIAVAASLINSWPGADAMMITGNPEATSLWLPPRTDVVTLPTVMKDPDGHYRSRTLNASLDSVVRMRAALIEAAVTSFAPDLLVVDKVPLGVAGELVPALRRLRDEHDTTIVLGLREILDDPVTAVADWQRSGATAAIEEFYDAVWIYGDRAVYDPVVEYGLPASVADRCVFTGYLAADRFVDVESPVEPDPFSRPYVLCTVGGGQDGADLARTFARTPPPDAHDGVVVCGPFMAAEAREAVHGAAATTPRMTVLDFVPDLHRLIAGASAVVSMAGYNSVCEVLATDRPALLVPRTAPRTEQLVRARRLAELGAADLLSADRLEPGRLSAWLDRAVGGPADGAVDMSPDGRCVEARAGLDVHGLRRLPGIAARLLAAAPAARREVDHRAA